jgi:DNA polymerase elongation subunit (family B)
MRLFLDIECYKNYFLVVLTTDTGKSTHYEIFNGDRSKFNRLELYKLVNHKKVELVTFNGASYDIPMLVMALLGKSTEELKDISDRIIEKGLRQWQIYNAFEVNEPEFNHIDLIEVVPGLVSLKVYGGRMHSKRMQDLPLPPDATIMEHQLVDMRKYCRNDTLVTLDLYNTLDGQIDLRRKMSEQYKTDLRSKSDAQIAEAVLKAEFQRLTGSQPPKTEITYDSFYYEPPRYVKFITENLRNSLDIITSSEMIVKDTGHVAMPKAIENMKIRIGDSTYKIGIGGLHSQESEVAHVASSDTLLVDKDVTSYYPNLMLNMGMSPGSFGEHFQTVYRDLLERRLKAKASGDSTVANSLKIVLNGTFGKTSNKYSRLYAPKMMIRTTLTGQLSLLMLIEALEYKGIPVVSANTDGIVIKCPMRKRDLMEKIVALWEKHTRLQTEETQYEALYSRDVNNYIAIKKGGGSKTKGVYGTTGISKNPQSEICSIAATKYLESGTPVEETIRSCEDITKFITVRTVSGGAVKDDKLLGKAIRWYYSTSTKSAIHYLKNGNTVPRSEGAMPIMDLPDEFPDDVDYGWYIDEARDILMCVGAVKRPQLEKIPRKNTKAWKALKESGDIVENRKGKWVWAHPEQHLGPSVS